MFSNHCESSEWVARSQHALQCPRGLCCPLCLLPPGDRIGLRLPSCPLAQPSLPESAGPNRAPLLRALLCLPLAQCPVHIPVLVSIFRDFNTNFMLTKETG